MTRARVSRAVPPYDAVIGALLEDADTGVLLIDPRGRIAAINRAGKRVLSRGSAPALRTVVPGEDPIREARDRARGEHETVLLAASGGEVPALVRTYRIGKPPWILVSIRDLTRIRRMQQELRRHERLATLGQLSAGVAHEIRNPLAGIGTSAQVLLRRFEPRDDRARFVQVILEEVGRLDRIVTSLLQYARPRAPELKRSTLEGCIDRVVELTSDAIGRARVVVEREVAPRLGDLYIDPDLVTQVVLNVTLNAVQAMPDGGTLRYHVRRVTRWPAARGAGRRSGDRTRREAGRGARDRSRIEYQQLRISDTGPGIPRGVLSKLFDPFFTTRPNGTGLGLSISQTIMQEHGGTIEIASREGRGTTVLLNFPVEKRHGERRDGNP
ncbi:MAG TPA: ATP-binding protein [Candidatus Udaeobacter sp.]|jgi:signal transduction histidine kinase|nr:ATP-binding protein [Candidatus Udaeobacter sp.]